MAVHRYSVGYSVLLRPLACMTSPLHDIHHHRLGRSVVVRPFSPKDVLTTIEGGVRVISFKIEEKVVFMLLRGMLPLMLLCC